ncbi:Lipid A biosynthesis lauroyltransferase [Polaribacter huanghezhanensis]|uniref:lysophospholipid acyltransferase family protein n=1 Tax=Polaribacter huanghezhanensis TaxID=1354726 RepID=UPI002647D817|nr:lysophospholipid acyltransferase family protein [Polaribacter huanghezhanensis]WKD86806.1 Lipid A biosynthesis lauroyltransferase [Polaribacter huanghezhanensis]
MHKLVFYLSYPIIWLFSKLPFRVLYIISDGLYYLLFYVVGYRKKVVLDNLKLSFPTKSDTELKLIRKRFFKHFTDVFIESIKSFSISEEELKKRYRFINPEVANEVAKEGKSIILLGSHYANWEWVISLPFVLNIEIFAAYTKLQNKYFEKAIKKNRTKYGMIGFKTSEFIKYMVKNIKNKRQGLYILLSDQSPQVEKTYYWKEFLGVKVPIHTGAEMLAKKFDCAVINFSCRKIKRGYYEIDFKTITTTPKEFGNYQIMDEYLKITEKLIREEPAYYLWSHKRFKHKDKAPN